MALRGGIVRTHKNHRTPDGFQSRAYQRAKIARLGPLPADARPWLKAAALLTLDLDRLAQDAETVRQAFTNGAGRRAREKARVTLRQLERRGARLRASLQAAEERLEQLANTNGHRRQTPADLLRDAHAAMAAARTEPTP